MTCRYARAADPTSTEGAGSSNLPFDPLQAPDDVRGPAEETPTAQVNEARAKRKAKERRRRETQRKVRP